jgi:hypothetical protein
MKPVPTTEEKETVLLYNATGGAIAGVHAKNPTTKILPYEPLVITASGSVFVLRYSSQLAKLNFIDTSPSTFKFIPAEKVIPHDGYESYDSTVFAEWTRTHELDSNVDNVRVVFYAKTNLMYGDVYINPVWGFGYGTSTPTKSMGLAPMVIRGSGINTFTLALDPFDETEYANLADGSVIKSEFDCTWMDVEYTKLYKCSVDMTADGKTHSRYENIYFMSDKDFSTINSWFENYVYDGSGQMWSWQDLEYIGEYYLKNESAKIGLALTISRKEI